MVVALKASQCKLSRAVAVYLIPWQGGMGLEEVDGCWPSGRVGVLGLILG